MKPNHNWRGDPVFLKELLEFWGVQVKELDGYKDRGHGDFGPIKGAVCHHTGSDNTGPWFIAQHPSLGLCAQIHLDRAGVATLCGVGLAWHAGAGSGYGYPPNGANQYTIGIEAVSSGSSPWPEAQMKAYARICAALCWFLGWNVDRIIGHKEWAGAAQGKWDPSFDMAAFRQRVAHELANPPSGVNTSPAVGAIDKENDMEFDNIKRRYRSRVAGSTVDMTPLDMLLNADAHAYIAKTDTAALRKEMEVMKATLEAIAKKVGA
ncbi:N-acetylmuramoyl-L-alanine amidase [Corynebacterium argentoratense]|uniref:peptidoglycan recognition protein family protein n=1 Tax=Corynebacterium argentoratense TaxID=42817 RepID=UPI0028D5C227|nr:N-acetylmuramoyl-L-alanine amidase [Corynebacterium argentoratense]